MTKKRGDYTTFTKWAVANGAEKEAPTNPYEVLRLRVLGGVAIIHTNKSGKHTFNDKARQLFEAFGKRQPMPLRPVAKVRTDGKRSATIKTLIARDGHECFFCGEEVQAGEETIEHLVPRTHGGPNHISNKFLADKPCNGRAGHMSAVEKIRLRDELRGHGKVAG